MPTRAVQLHSPSDVACRPEPRVLGGSRHLLPCDACALRTSEGHTLTTRLLFPILRPWRSQVDIMGNKQGRLRDSIEPQYLKPTFLYPHSECAPARLPSRP